MASESKSTSSAARPQASKAGRQEAESLGFLAIAAGVIIALNVLGVFFFFRADTTENRAFSLSEGSRRVVNDLDETLSVTAYFSADLPPPFNSTERYVRDILAEYQSAGRGNVQVRFVSPDTDDEREEANDRGVQLVQHQNIEDNAVSVVEGYRGLVFEYLGERQTIPVIQPDTQGLEYEITMAIKRLTGERVAIGLPRATTGPRRRRVSRRSSACSRSTTCARSTRTRRSTPRSARSSSWIRRPSSPRPSSAGSTSS